MRELSEQFNYTGIDNLRKSLLFLACELDPLQSHLRTPTSMNGIKA